MFILCRHEVTGGEALLHPRTLRNYPGWVPVEAPAAPQLDEAPSAPVEAAVAVEAERAGKKTRSSHTKNQEN